MLQQSENLPHSGDGDLTILPLLALNNLNGAVTPQHQIHTAVCTVAAEFFSRIATSAKDLADESFEIEPGNITQAVQVTSRLEQAPPVQGREEGRN
jgi:hypothetical protein